MAFEKAKQKYQEMVLKYSGQSVDELLALTNGKEIDFLWAIEIAIQKKSEKTGLSGLSEEERIVLAIEGLEREVNNGGYSQFFTNSSGVFAPIIVDSLLRIGCPENAQIAKSAIDALGIQDLSPESLHAAIVSNNNTLDEALDECDQLYYQGGENIGGKLIDFVKANKNVIHP